ncbi:MAG: hypothetical protein PT934_06665 [Peptoniphilaceae bacterium]|uniref:hypothetical protein n=1 Tax=Parvimonas sp. TaxID=1944660 RepID=UPI0025EE99C6|nr:hypothetical protein [Parvimonas sp.]MCI5997295.1 hypothetical protein [Parvimonas sp.]MDD7765431.1 hypothetical protein [Peptoniphilaceae bacterium]MDY3050972.1 hypothetical protein [Parvimonas sp.]
MKLKKGFLFILALNSSILLSNFTNVKAEESIHSNKLTLLSNQKRMTYDEILSEMIKDGFSKEKALSILGTKPKISLRSSQNEWYTTIEDTVNVTSEYRVKPKFYIKAEGAHGVYFIRQVLSASLDRSYNGISKTFSGELYYNLESKTSLYYRLNGDFYNNGSINISGGASIGLGQGASLNFGVSYSTSHYKYIYKEGYINYGRY